jgi:two-component system nitrate/nitrite sensor histidine kinase NarX
LHIVSEALGNIGCHAGSTQAWVSLKLHDGQVEDRVEDNGSGLPAAAAKSPVAAGHHGIEIMRDRARRLGGMLDLMPRPGGGTTLELDFPMAYVVRRA